MTDGISIVARGIPSYPPTGRVTPAIDEEFRRQGQPGGGVAVVRNAA